MIVYLIAEYHPEFHEESVEDQVLSSGTAYASLEGAVAMARSADKACWDNCEVGPYPELVLHEESTTECEQSPFTGRIWSAESVVSGSHWCVREQRVLP